MMDAAENLAPYKNSFTLDKVRGISSALEHSKTVVETAANWLETKEDYCDPEILANMNTIPEAPPRATQ